MAAPVSLFDLSWKHIWNFLWKSLKDMTDIDEICQFGHN